MDAKGMNRYSVPALERGLAIIELLVHSNQSLGVTDIHMACDIPKSSIFMILATLESLGYVEKLPGDKYKATLKIYNLGTVILSKLDIRAVARPVMESLAEELHFTVHLGIFDQRKATYIEKVSGPGFVQFSTKIGQSTPLYYSAVGKALAAYLPEETLDAIMDAEGFIPFTPNTIRTPTEFKQFLQTVRELGYSIEDEEGEAGIRCIGAPIRDHSGNVAAALSVTAVRNQLPSTRFAEVGQLVRDKANIISRKLGYPRED